jgi:hypothetical protein
MKTKPMTAWLIQWHWTGENNRVEKPLVDIVSARKNIRYVKEYVQRLHNLHRLTLHERVPVERYKKPSEQICKAQATRTKGGITIHCGHNPFLVATLVKNLVVTTDDASGEESVTWDPYYA